MLKEISFDEAVKRASQGEEGIFMSIPIRMGSMVMDDLVKLNIDGAVCLFIKPDKELTF